MPVDTEIAREYFRDRVDVWRPGGLALNLLTGTDEEVGAELVALAVQVMLDPKGESASSSPVGRMNRDNMLTTDMFYFADDAIDVEDGYFLRLVTPGHPENGGWYTVVGGRQTWSEFGASGVPAIRSLGPGVKP